MRLGFREIALEIRQEVTNGRYPPGSVLPPEPQLAQRYGASRSLVNRALQVLAAEGVVRPQRGRGTIVTWLPPILHSPAQDYRPGEDDVTRVAFDVAISRLGLDPENELTTEHTEPPSEIPDTLGLAIGEANCLARRRRLLASGIPVRLDTSWFPWAIAGGSVLEGQDQEIVGGVKAALARLGYPQVTARELIIPSRLPTGPEAFALDISPDRTVIEITHVGMTAERKAVEVTVSVAPAHYLMVEYEYPIPGSEMGAGHSR